MPTAAAEVGSYCALGNVIASLASVLSTIEWV